MLEPAKLDTMWVDVKDTARVANVKDQSGAEVVAASAATQAMDDVTSQNESSSTGQSVADFFFATVRLKAAPCRPAELTSPEKGPPPHFSGKVNSSVQDQEPHHVLPTRPGRRLSLEQTTSPTSKDEGISNVGSFGENDANESGASGSSTRNTRRDSKSRLRVEIHPVRGQNLEIVSTDLNANGQVVTTLTRCS